MMGLATIRKMSDDAARMAREEGVTLQAVTEEDLASSAAMKRGVRIKFIGTHVPAGWQRTEREEAFVDTSGFGSPHEPAMTQEQFRAWMRPGYAYALTEIGQFQGYVAEFERAK